MTSSKSNYLLKILSLNTIILERKAYIYEYWWDIIQFIILVEKKQSIFGGVLMLDWESGRKVEYRKPSENTIKDLINTLRHRVKYCMMDQACLCVQNDY